MSLMQWLVKLVTPPGGKILDPFLGSGSTGMASAIEGFDFVGMEKEEASFRTYVNLVGQSQDEQSREVLLALAEEEVKHKLRFEAEYDMLLRKI